MNFVAARSGEARVWNFFSKWSNIPDFQEEYYDYASGWNVSHRMPWSVPVREKLGVRVICSSTKKSFVVYLLIFVTNRILNVN